MVWPVYDAKARFSELLDAALKKARKSSPVVASKPPFSSPSTSGDI